MSQPFTASARRLTSLCSAGLLCVAVASCSAPPEPAYEEPAPPPPTRWIRIDGSDAGAFETRCASIHLEGLAFSSEGEATVSWRNLTTGETGDAFHEALQYDESVESWRADVPLALGPNALVVVMVDRLDVPTEGSTIAERLPGVAISGRVESTPGVALGGIRVT